MTVFARLVVGLVLFVLFAMACYAAAMTLIWYSQCGSGQAC